MKVFELEPNVTGFLQIEWDKDVSELMDREEPRKKSKIWGKILLQTIKGIDKKGTPLGDCPYFSAGNSLIVSDRLKELIRAFTEDELEFLPVEIDGKTGYWYMNVLCVLNAIDVEKSELKRFESSGRIMYVIKGHYLDDVINGHRIFRLTNCGGVYITEDLKRYLEDNHVISVTYRDMSVRVENPLAEVLLKPKKKKPKFDR